MARYYRVKAQSLCPHCKAPVVSSVLCEACKARERAKPTTDRELRMMKRSRKTLHAGRQARGLCIYCEAKTNTTQYLGCQECRRYRLGELRRWRLEAAAGRGIQGSDRE